MLNRRHIRIKTMQELFAFLHTDQTMPNHIKSLQKSYKGVYDLYLTLLNFMLALKIEAKNEKEAELTKTFTSQIRITQIDIFLKNKFFSFLESSLSCIEDSEKQKIKWSEYNDFVRQVWRELQKDILYKNYIENTENSLKVDLNFMEKVFVKYVAPNEKLHDFFESEDKHWLSDVPAVNTMVVQTIQSIDKQSVYRNVFKNEQDREFGEDLLKNSISKYDEITKYIYDSLQNWDKDRISKIDFVLLVMAVAEFLYFPSIPVLASINEYIEISKEYSSPKSKSFINGILENIKKLLENNKIIN